MARKSSHGSKRKHDSVPLEAYRFIGNLEKILKIDIFPQGSHLDVKPRTNARHDTQISLQAKTMLEQSPPPQAPSFMGAIDLLSNGADFENVDSATLRKAIEPIWTSLENLDAVSMLGLDTTTKKEGGARVSNGVYCKPIHDAVTPRRIRKEGDTVVRYVHISEVEEKYSVGIFIFPPHACIPLHDHPHMVVLSRILYGSVQRTSLDLARPQQDDDASWFPRFSKTLRPTVESRRAFLNGVDTLRAPCVTALYPYEGQLHEFCAGPHGAAVLDVLLPPYDEHHDRDCTFYRIEKDTTSTSTDQRHPCWIVPTTQPTNFHCLSGRYNELGGDYFDDDDDEST